MDYQRFALWIQTDNLVVIFSLVLFLQSIYDEFDNDDPSIRQRWSTLREFLVDPNIDDYSRSCCHRPTNERNEQSLGCTLACQGPKNRSAPCRQEERNSIHADRRKKNEEAMTKPTRRPFNPMKSDQFDAKTTDQDQELYKKNSNSTTMRLRWRRIRWNPIIMIRRRTDELPILQACRSYYHRRSKNQTTKTKKTTKKKNPTPMPLQARPALIRWKPMNEASVRTKNDKKKPNQLSNQCLADRRRIRQRWSATMINPARWDPSIRRRHYSRSYHQRRRSIKRRTIDQEEEDHEA